MIYKHYLQISIVRFERPDWDEYFMLQAELAKLRSNCMIRKVGAVIVRNHRQIATGYNGTPPGVKNCYEGGCKKTILENSDVVPQGHGLELEIAPGFVYFQNGPL